MRGARPDRRAHRALLLGGALIWLSVLPSALGQSGEKGAQRPAVDPFTRGAAAAMAELGIRRFGPFRFGDGRSTAAVAKEAGSVGFLWLQSAHFQVGSSLDAQPFPADPKAKKRLRGELKQLGRRLPNLPRKPSELEPWLLLHLYAARLEELYTVFVERFQLVEFAKEHPYLGTGGPFCVLMTEKRSTFARYCEIACNSHSDSALRFYFDKPCAQMFFGIAFESLEGDLHNDAGLHFALVHGVSQMLGEGVRGYNGQLPTWFSVGLGHWFARELIDDKILLYTTPLGEAGRGEEDANFAAKIRRRVLHGAVSSFARMETWNDPSKLRFPDHMLAWARMDFLLRDAAGERAHGLLWAFSESLAWSVPDREERRKSLCQRALLDVAGGDLQHLDDAFGAWVLKNYPKR